MGAMLCFLRDLFTGDKQQYTTAEILVLLETLSRDPDIFPNGEGVAMWNEPNLDEIS